MSVRAGLNLDALNDLYDESSVEIRESAKVLSIPKHSIYAVEQVRTVFDEEKLMELSISLEVNGQEQPIIVYAEDGKGYKIQKGERRWRAAMMNDKITHLDCVVRSAGDIFGQLIENIQREDLLPLELAHSFAAAKKEFDLDNRQLAARLGKSENYVSKHLQILNAPDCIIEAHKSGLIGDVDTINELRKAHKANPKSVERRLQDGEKVSRQEAIVLKSPSAKTSKKKPKPKKGNATEKELLNQIVKVIREAQAEASEQGEVMMHLQRLIQLADQAEKTTKK